MSPLTTPPRNDRGNSWVSPPRLFPVAPLLALLPAASGRERGIALGVTRRQVLRYQAQRALSAAQADLLASRAGYHPAEIWGDLWWQTAGQEAM